MQVKVKSKPKVKRNYQFVQFLLDFFSLFQLYLLFACIYDIFALTKEKNEFLIRAAGGESVMMNPYPVIVWGGLSVVVFVAAIIFPFVKRKSLDINQKQFDIWVYSLYLIRMLLLLIIFFALDIHLSFIIYTPKSVIDFGIIGSLFLIAIIVRFTQIRIKAAKTLPLEENLGDETENKEKVFIED